MRPFFSTLRFRITLLYVAVFGITLLLFSAILYAVYQRHQAADFDRRLYKRALGIARSISIDAHGQLEINQTLIAESGKLFPFEFGNEYIEIRSPDGKSLAHSKNLETHSLPLDANLLALIQQGQFAYVTMPSMGKGQSFWGEGDLRLLSMPLIARGSLQILLQLGVSTQAHDQSLARLRTALFLIGVPLAILLAGTGGWWLARRAFLPINRIVSAAQRLSAEGIEERLPVPQVDDELKRLSVTLNEMLDRLEKAFKSQQRFVADASHELKTPLTILQGELDVLRQQPRSIEEYQAFLASASEELQRISQIIHNLLLLARADSGRPLKLKDGVRLDEITLEAMERLQPFANRMQVKLLMQIENPEGRSSEETPTVRGDADLLASLFFNLIHNAVKHSAAGQTVEIRLRQTADESRVLIRDHGTGIRPEDLPHIFERFHRAESPTRQQTAGTGLGLAIAQWIARTHGAKILVESKPAEGSAFSVVFGQSHEGHNYKAGSVTPNAAALPAAGHHEPDSDI
ncbi:MAG: HAMP domain-containing protein [Verrucomicrobia bacterium]|nr:HAMP domain-containing protein [Verrucomicrobiota bacterium]